MNHTLSQAWLDPQIALQQNVALSLLKPTPAQLQRGLELHAQATVVDSYGFSAAANADLSLTRIAAEQKATPEAVRRIYIESGMTRMALDAHQRTFFEQAWRASGVTCVIRNSGEEGNRPEIMMERLAYNTFVTDRLPDIMTRAITAQDVLSAKAKDRRCFIYTTNGVPLSMAQRDVRDELRFIRLFRQLGVRMMHMTYNRRNPLGEGCAETNDGGLSDLGREAIAEMNRIGIIVDTAHSSQRTCIEAAACSTKPIMISHSACAALNKHCRGKGDHVLRAVADRGGVTGIAAIPAFLGGSGDINALLDHIDHAIRVAGADHVAIGTDVVTPLPPSPGDETEIKLQAMPRHYESHWPANDALFDPHWNQPAMVQSLAWTNWPLFTVGLVQRGHSDEAILKVIGANALRVLRAADEALDFV